MILFVLLSLSTLVAQTPEHHTHVGSSEITFNYEFLDFKNSKQKENGRRYGLTLDHQDRSNHFQFYAEHTDTKTKPVLPTDLSVNKYALKYQYTLDKRQTLSMTFLHIDDNLADEVDGGKIYGLGYRYRSLSFMQYLSDYRRFEVYQSDIKWGMKKKFFDTEFKAGVIGKYIHLNNKESNSFTSKAEEDYFTLGMKLHMHYEEWHTSVSGYVGDRIFTVMNDGLRVQHHAMEFEKSYMVSLGREFDDLFLNLIYIKQYAKEVPIENDNVKAQNITINLTYRF
jgi:hypothetical protein